MFARKIEIVYKQLALYTTGHEWTAIRWSHVYVLKILNKTGM